MTTITSIAVTYQANYNGVDICVNEELGIDEVGPENKKKFEQIIETVVGRLYEECDDDGEFDGSMAKAKAYILETVSAIFPNVTTSVEFDTRSS